MQALAQERSVAKAQRVVMRLQAQIRIDSVLQRAALVVQRNTRRMLAQRAVMAERSAQIQERMTAQQERWMAKQRHTAASQPGA